MIHHQSNSKYFLSRTTLPNVGILASDSAESLCLKYNVSLVELLRPFCKISERIRVHNKEDHELSVDINDFEINLVDIKNSCLSAEFCAKFIDMTVKNCHPCPKSDQLLSEFYGESPGVQYWYQSYVELMAQMIIPLHVDYLRHIIGCIIVMSTSDADILSTSRTLNDKLERMINNENVKANDYVRFFTGNIYRYIILMHDSSTITREKMESDVSLLKRLFVSGYYVLCLGSEGNNEDCINPWFYDSLLKQKTNDIVDSLDQDLYHENSRRFSSFAFSTFCFDYKISCNDSNFRNYVALLSKDDQINIQIMMADFIVNGLVPHLIMMIQDISYVIENTKPKTSLVGNAKLFFKGKILSKNAPPSTLLAMKLRLYPESWQVLYKKFADLQYILKNYDSAEKHYKLFLKVYNESDRNIVKKVCIEMLNNICILKNEDSNLICGDLLECVKSYISNKYLDYGLRASFVYAEYLFEHKMTHEALKLYNLNINLSGHLKKAVLFDRMGYYCMVNGLTRYASLRHLIAGIYYYQIDHIYHSLRCMHYCRNNISNMRFNVARDYLNEFILNRCTNIENLVESSLSVSNLLLHSDQPPEKQNQQLDLYLGIMKTVMFSPFYSRFNEIRSSTTTPFHPCFVIQFLKINFRNILTELCDRIIPFVVEGEVNPQLTQTACKCAIWEINNQLVRIQDALSSFVPEMEILCKRHQQIWYLNHHEPIKAYVNETISLTIPLSTTLKVPIRMSNIKLIWTLKLEDKSSITFKEIDSQAYIDVSTIQSHSLEPESTHQLVFLVNFKHTGTLKISGLTYTLSSEDKLESLDYCITVFKDNHSNECMILEIVIQSQKINSLVKCISEPSKPFQNIQYRLDFKISDIDTLKDSIYIWTSINRSCMAVPISENEFVEFKIVNIRKKPKKKNCSHQDMRVNIYHLHLKPSFKAKVIDFSIIMDSINTSDLNFDILVAFSFSDSIKLFYKHFHLFPSKLFDFQVINNHMSIAEIERLLNNTPLLPPIKFSICPLVSADLTSITFFERTAVAYIPLNDLVLTDIFKNDSSINELNLIFVNNQSKNIKKVIIYKAETITPYHMILSENILKGIKQVSIIPLMVFYKISIRHVNIDYISDGCSLFYLKINQDYLKPTHSHISPIYASDTFLIKVEFYYDRSVFNETNVFIVGIGIWNLSNSPFLLKIEAISADIESPKPIIFLGKLEVQVHLEPLSQPIELIKFCVFAANNMELDASLFKFSICHNDQTYKCSMSIDNTICFDCSSNRKLPSPIKN